MKLPEDIKHLIVEWLEHMFTVASSQKSRIAHTYSQALGELRKTPIPIKHPNQLINIKFIGEKIVSIMNHKLEAYCKENGFDMPIDDEEKERIALKKRSRLESIESSKSTTGRTKSTKKSKAKRYVPNKDSGGYAIMLALLIHDKHGNGLTKAEISRLAAPFTTTSFQNNSSTGKYYSAWSSMNTLLNNEYVVEEGKPKYYSLTETGLEVAKVLKEEHESSNGPIRSVTEPIPQNKLFVDNYSNTLLSKKRANTSINPLNSSSPNINKYKSDSIISSSPFRGGIMNDLKSKGITPSSPLTKEISEKNPINLSEVIRGTSLSTSKSLSSNNRSDYQIWKNGSYEIKFVLDNREVFSKDERNAFTKQLESMGINLVNRALPVGDGTWIAVNRHTKQESMLDFIFERKRLDDLAASIIDGRYREQKNRLEKTGMKTIFYIVEEQTASDLSAHSESIKTCMSMNTTYSSFHTKRTKSPDETMQLINEITDQIYRIYSGKTLMVLEPRSLITQDEYKNLLIRMREEYRDKEVVYSYNTFDEIMNKSATITVKEVFVRILMTIKGIGLEKAIAIQSHYKVPRNLILAYKKCHEKNPQDGKIQPHYENLKNGLVWNKDGDNDNINDISKLPHHDDADKANGNPTTHESNPESHSSPESHNKDSKLVETQNNIDEESIDEESINEKPTEEEAKNLEVQDIIDEEVQNESTHDKSNSVKSGGNKYFDDIVDLDNSEETNPDKHNEWDTDKKSIMKFLNKQAENDPYLKKRLSVFSRIFELISDCKPNIEKLDNYPNGKSGVQFVHGYEEPYLTKEKLLTYLSLSEKDINDLTEQHSRLIEQLPNYFDSIYEKDSKGIVYVGGNKFSWLTLISIINMRKNNCQLPIEVLIPKYEEFELNICENILPKYNAKCIYLPTLVGDKVYEKYNFKGYQYKSLALALSSFENVLLLDADNTALVDPETVFHSNPYVEYGLLLWPDFWKRTTHPSFYDIIGLKVDENKRRDFGYKEYGKYSKPVSPDGVVLYHQLENTLPDPTTESGQLFMSKKKHFKALILSLYYNTYGPDYYYPLLSQGAA
ncbi:Crossover junction endonuclease mus81, partial [Pichia californica]